MKTLDEMKQSAWSEREMAKVPLNQLVKVIGMIGQFPGSTDHPQGQLMTTLETYIRAAARYEVLEILKSEDFYIAMTRSAGAMEQAQ